MASPRLTSLISKKPGWHMDVTGPTTRKAHGTHRRGQVRGAPVRGEELHLEQAVASHFDKFQSCQFGRSLLWTEAGAAGHTLTTVRTTAFARLPCRDAPSSRRHRSSADSICAPRRTLMTRVEVPVAASVAVVIDTRVTKRVPRPASTTFTAAPEARKQ